MIEKNITLSQIISHKGGTIEELCQYAKMKGISLPNDPEYIVSPSELSIIDPILAYKLKFTKHMSSNICENIDSDNSDSKDADNMEIDPAKLLDNTNEKLHSYSQQQVSTTDDLEAPNNQTNTTDNKTNQKTKKAKRIIGIVKFYDSSKDFGFVISGNKGISGKPEDEGKLFSLHITSSEWKSSSYPKDKEWIILTPRKNSRGWSALNAERLECNRETLLFAMKYRGKYAKISGLDSKGDHFDENILCHIINQMTLTRRVGISSYSYGSVTYDT